MDHLLQKFKCHCCKIIPDSDVYQCKNNHIVCKTCKNKNRGICKCKQNLQRKAENPLIKELTKTKDECHFKSLGCTWSFLPSEMDEHLSECKFRTIPCIGATLQTWTCGWKGQLSNMENHFKEHHRNLGEPFNYFQFSEVPFDENNTISTVNLINAFNKHFVFYYHSDTKMVYFVIFLIGRKIDADQFFYEFVIKSSEDNCRKIKFVENCYSDCVDIKTLLSSEKCVALTMKTIKNHIRDKDNLICFRFNIAKKSADDKIERLQRQKSSSFCIDENSTHNQKPTKTQNKPTKFNLSNNEFKGYNSSLKNLTPSSPSSLNRNFDLSPTVMTNSPSSINKFNKTDVSNTLNSPCLKPSINKNIFFQ